MDINTWKTKVQEKMQRLGYWLNQPVTGPTMVYGTLTGLTLWPLVEQAAQTGSLSSVLPGLLGVGANIGTNLVATQIEKWKDQKPTEEKVITWAQTNAADAEARGFLDEMIEKLDAMQAAQPVMAAHPEWQKQLFDELKRLGNLPRFEAKLKGIGIIIQGEGHQFHAPVTVIETQHIHEAPPVPDLITPARARYFHDLINQCNALPLAELGGEGGLDKEVGLEHVYIDLNTTTRVPLQKGESQERHGLPGQEKDRPLTALEAAAQHKRLVLLGDPGSGKSSFVRHLAARLAAAYQNELHSPPPGWSRLFPLLIPLRHLIPHLKKLDLPTSLSISQRHERLRRALQTHWQEMLAPVHAAELRPEIEDRFASGELLLILDGLDEVAEPLRERVQQLVAALNTPAHLIVTCRIRSWHDSLLPGFAVHTLAPFTPEQIKTFVVAWYKGQNLLGRLTPAEAQERTLNLQQAAARPNLRPLAENPLLLTTMTIIHQQKTRLPDEKVRLYKLGVEVLIKNWQGRKGLDASDALKQWLDKPDDLRPILERVAYETHTRQANLSRQTSRTRQQAAELTRGELLTILEDRDYFGSLPLAEEFLDYVDQRAGLLVGQGGDNRYRRPTTYAFPHRTFQEYLAGCYLVTNRDMDRLISQLAEAGDYWTVAVQMGTEELWYNNPKARSLFLNLAYDLCPAMDAQTPAEWRAVLWSGQMAVVAGKEQIQQDTKRNGGERYLMRLGKQVTAIIRGDKLPPLERAEAARVLAALGEPERPEVREVDAMQFGLIPAGPFWMGSNEDNPFEKDAERPLHENNILNYPYWLGRFPVTNAQFRQFVNDEGYQTARYWPEAHQAGRWREDGWVRGYYWNPDGNPEQGWREGRPYDYGIPFSLPNHPVVGVMWYEALAFCRWLTERWQAQGWLPDGYTVQLPSEAEWEKGARGGVVVPQKAVIVSIRELVETLGTRRNLVSGEQLAVSSGQSLVSSPQSLNLSVSQSPNPRRFPWGDEPYEAEYLNADVTQLGGPSGVGCFPLGQSVYGLEEMVGNVFEWTRSVWMKYPYGQERGREDLTAGDTTSRVIRGGSYLHNDKWARCASRLRNHPDNRRNSIGFRVVLSPP